MVSIHICNVFTCVYVYTYIYMNICTFKLVGNIKYIKKMSRRDIMGII